MGKKKVYGFYSKDAERIHSKFYRNHWMKIRSDKFVPVVSVEEHERIVNEERKKLYKVISELGTRYLKTRRDNVLFEVYSFPAKKEAKKNG